MLLALFTCVVICIVSVNGQAPIVDIRKTEPATFSDVYIEAIRDQDVIMDCFVDNKMQENAVRWQRKYRLKNGTDSILQISQDMALEDNIQYSIERPTQFKWRLRIRAIQVTHIGTYYCYVQTTLNSRVQDFRVVDVVFAPYFDLQKTSSSMTVEAGQDVDLICNATARPPPIIEWTRLGGALLPIGQEKKQGSLLQIRKIKPEDRGIYRCEAKNSIGEVRTNIELRVRFEPIVTVQNDVVYQAIGYRIELICVGEANPKSLRHQAFWSRSGVPLPSSSDEYETRFVEGAFGIVTFELIIFNVQEKMYGTYVCNIRNLQGNGERAITLEKTNEPQKSIKLGRIIAASSMPLSSPVMLFLSLFIFLYLRTVG